MDGEITIGTKLSTEQIDRQIAKLEKNLTKEEEKLKLKITSKEVAEQDLKKHQEMVANLKAEYDKLAPTAQEYYNIVDKINSSQKISASDYKKAIAIENTSVIADYEKIKAQLENMEVKEDRLKAKVEQKNYAYKQIVDRINEYQQKINNLKMARSLAEVEELKKRFNGVGNSIQKSITKVARLALGIFGIRSAYLALRRASSDLASYDQQYATNLEYIRYALTQAIAPVLQWIVNLAAKLLGYINAIMQGWFGINLFSRGSADNFKQMKTQASGVGKAVQEIKKQLAGFDEMNVLQEDGSTSTGGGGGGITMPEFDLSAMQAEVPEWLQWIIDHKDEILSILAGIAAGLVAIKFGLGGIKALGIGILVKGIIDLITSLKDYLEDPSWENFGKVIKAIGEIILGLGIIIGNVPLIVAGAIAVILGLIIKNWDKIKEFLQKGIDWLTNKSDWVHKMFGDTIGNIYDTFVKNLQLILNWFDMTFKNIKQILDGIIQFVKGVFTGNWEQAWKGIKQIFGAIWDWIKNTVFTILDIVWNVFSNVVDTIGDLFKGLWNIIVEGAKATWNWITGIFGNIGNFFKNIVSTIIGFFGNLGARAGEVISGAFKSVVNGVLRAIENILNTPIRAINGLISVINAIPGINISRLNTFSLPRLKTGGIINMPNKGTMIGGAIAGESGRERSITFDRYTSNGDFRKRNRQVH